MSKPHDRAHPARSYRFPVFLAGSISVGVISFLTARGDTRPEEEAERVQLALTAGSELASVAEPSGALAEFLAVAERVRNGPNPWIGQGSLAEITAALAAPGLSARKERNLRMDQANELLRLGRIDEALATIEPAIAAAEGSAERWRAREAYRVRALAWMRKAELQNCVDLHNRECCIFPLERGGVHSVSAPARSARDDYLAFLSLLPDDASTDPASKQHGRYWSAVWLLNVACMAAGEYPAGVPERYRIPAEVFASDVDLGRFVDVAPALGVDAFDHAGSVVVDDLDGDGRLDIVTCSCDVGASMRAFRNPGDGSFEDVTEAAGLSGQLGGLHLVGADYDNDGDLDLLVPRGAWMLDDGCIRRSLLRNDGGVFTDVTRAAGVAELAAPSQAVVFADFDGDGWLDFYVGNESRVEIEAGAPSYPSQLFRNDRDGTFTDVAAEAGVTNDRYAKGVCAGDYDGDGDMDLYVSNCGPNRLYRNDGGMRFTDVAPELGLVRPAGRSFSCWFFDYDEDGDLDLWVSAYESELADVALSALGQPNAGVAPCLYENRGNGTFREVAEERGLDRAWLPMGASFGDYDNDGWLDVYLGTGDPGYETLVPNVALRNDGGRRFQDVTWSGGFGHLQKGHGTSFADLDDDGDQDLYHQLGGFFPGDAFRNALFLNPGQGNHWVKIELVGVETNRQAIGARIEVEVETPAGPRTLHRAVGSVASFGNSPRRQEIGLGDATSIREVRVLWPRTGGRQTFTGVALDSSVRITEGAETFERVGLHPVDLTGTRSEVRPDDRAGGSGVEHP
jgi:hypothetical protein